MANDASVNLTEFDREIPVSFCLPYSQDEMSTAFYQGNSMNNNSKGQYFSVLGKPENK